MGNIITHIDIDGIIAGYLMNKIYPSYPIILISTPQRKTIKTTNKDIILDLQTENKEYKLHYDHHLGSPTPPKGKGKVDLKAPSTCQILLDEYPNQLNLYKDLIQQVNKIDMGLVNPHKPTPLGIISMALTSTNCRSNKKLRETVLSWLQQELNPSQIVKKDIIQRRYTKKLAQIQETINKTKITKDGKILILQSEEKYPAKASVFFIAQQNPDTNIILSIIPANKNTQIRIKENTFSKIPNKINLGELARDFNGIGKPNHAGIRTEEPQKILPLIVRKIKELHRIEKQ